MILQYQLLCPSINYFEDLLVPVSPRVRSIACSLTCPGSCATGPPQQLPEEKIGAVQDSVAVLDKQLDYMAQVRAILLDGYIPRFFLGHPALHILFAATSLEAAENHCTALPARPTPRPCPPARVLSGCCCCSAAAAAAAAAAAVTAAAAAAAAAGATKSRRTAGARLSRS